MAKRAENPKSILCGIIKSFRAAFNAFKKISGNYLNASLFLFLCLFSPTILKLSPSYQYIHIIQISLGGQCVP